MDAQEIIERAKNAVKDRVIFETKPEEEEVSEVEVPEDIGDEPTDADVGVDEEGVDQPDPDAEEESPGDESPEGEDSEEEAEEEESSEEEPAKDDQPGMLLKDYTQGKQALARGQALVDEKSRRLDEIMSSPAQLEAFLKGKGLSVTKKEVQKIIEYSEEDMVSDMEKKIIDGINLLGTKVDEQANLGLSLKQTMGESEAARKFSSMEAEFKVLAATPELKVPESVFPMVAMLLERGIEQFGPAYTVTAALTDYKKLNPQEEVPLDDVLGSLSEEQMLAILNKKPELYGAVEKLVLKQYRKKKTSQNKGTKTASSKGSATAPVIKPSKGPKTLEQLKIDAKAKVERERLAGRL